MGSLLEILTIRLRWKTMPEKIIATIRNAPNGKIDLLYDENGWKVQSHTGEIFRECFIIRAWVRREGEGQASVREVRLLPDEFRHLQEAE